MNPRSSGKRTVASLQDLRNRACEAASSSLWKVPVPGVVATSTIATCVFSPEPATLVKRKAVVSYLLLTKVAGSGENTHVAIVEVATAPGTGTFQRELEAASQALFRKSWSDATVRFPELRGFMHAELYTPAGQRP